MRSLLRAFLAFSCILSTLKAADPIPIEAFLTPPPFKNPKLSPDGRFCGFVETAGDLEYLNVMDLTTRQTRRAAAVKDLKLINYFWKRSGSVLILVEDLFGQRSWRSFNLNTNETNYLNAFNFVGSTILDPLVDEPDEILVSTESGVQVELRRINVRTGKSTVLQKTHCTLGNPLLVDRSGHALAGLGRTEQKWFMLLASDTERGGWRRVELGEKNMPDFWPLGVAPDQRRILGFDYTGEDKVAVVAWDPVNDAKEVVWQSAEVDPDYLQKWGDDLSIKRAVAYKTDRRRFHYFLPADEKQAKIIDATLPDTVNTIASTSADGSKMIIECSSDVIAQSFYLLDKNTGQLVQLGLPHPQIDPARLAPSRAFTFRTRDGLDVHGQISLPRGSSGPQPAVLMIGSPLGARSASGYQALEQILASRGYAVVLIDQRGTVGYGLKFAEAGNLQIMGAMADDVVDGTRWLAKEGLIDPARVAIMGTRRGGLVALGALTRYPESFKLWINFGTTMDAGRLDFDEIVFGRYTEQETTARVGGYNAGREYLRSLYPVPLLRDIKVPSFHFYARNSFDNTSADGDQVEKYFAKAGLPYVFTRGRPASNAPDSFEIRAKANREDSTRIYGEMVAFLDKHLGSRKP